MPDTIVPNELNELKIVPKGTPTSTPPPPSFSLPHPPFWHLSFVIHYDIWILDIRLIPEQTLT